MTDANEDKQSKDNADKQALQEAATDQANAEQATDVKPDKQTKSGNRLFVFLLLLVIAVAATLDFYHYKSLQEFNSLLDASTSAGTTMQGEISRLEQQMQTTRESYAAISSKLDALEARQESLRELIPEPATETIELNEEFALAEIEHLLTIANYRLQLNHDVSTALKAMETADLRLQRLNVPGSLQVREQLIADMNSLRSLNQADLSGLGLFLSDLIKRVDSLPVKEDVIVTSPEFEEVQPDATAENKAREFFRLIWAELKSLVIISRDQNINKTMLLPDEIYFLRSNIKLELANARFAVFNRDTENFNASIEHLQDWLQNYFDKSDASVRNISESLQRMSRINLAFPSIDISSSIESVKALAHRVSQQQEEVQE